MKMTTAIPAGMVAPIEAAVRLSASCGSALPTLRRSVTANGEGLSPSRLAPAAGQRAFRSAIGGILDQLEYPVDDTGVVVDVPVEGGAEAVDEAHRPEAGTRAGAAAPAGTIGLSGVGSD